MEERPLKYQGYAIVCEEVPDEISIAFNISGCEHRCPDCHSKYLWEYGGRYLRDDLLEIIAKYKGLISCLCFLGGDQNIDELDWACHVAKFNGLKTCIYSGEDSIEPFNELIERKRIDYLKIGKYDAECGPLNKPTTNQIMYKFTDDGIEDITYRFQKKLE